MSKRLQECAQVGPTGGGPTWTRLLRFARHPSLRCRALTRHPLVRILQKAPYAQPLPPGYFSVTSHAPRRLLTGWDRAVTEDLPDGGSLRCANSGMMSSRKTETSPGQGKNGEVEQ